MEALRRMARGFILRRAIAAAWPALRTKPATGSSSLGRAGGGLVEEAVLDEASMKEFSRLVADHYVKQMKAARAAGVGFAGVSAAALAGFGIDRLNSSSVRKDQ